MAFSIGVIGLGRMAQVILHGLFDSNNLKSEEVFGVVGKENSVQRVLDQFPKTGISVVHSQDVNASHVWEAPIKILAVKPQQLSKIEEKKYSQTNFELGEKTLLISILAGVKLEKLESMFPLHDCVRAVPNTPSLVRSGLTGLAWGRGISKKQKELVEEIDNILSEPDPKTKLAKAEANLPNTTGCFFGSQEYDKYYFEDLKYTKERMQACLDWQNKMQVNPKERAMYC